jgi:hypothetical protein
VAPGTCREVISDGCAPLASIGMSVTDHRNEQVQRALLWRYLTGDDDYDVDHYLTRLEGPAAVVSA